MGKMRYVQLTTVSAAALLIGLGNTGQANAGAYSVREQSAQFMGTSFAGDAAGGDLSSMFWNPAATASLDGINFSANASLLFSSSNLTAMPDSLFYNLGAGSGSYGRDALVPATYANYQLSDRWYLGLALNSPFGFTTKPSNEWAGSPIEITSKVFTLDINPTLAYKLTPEIMVGAGLQVEYFEVWENSGAGAIPPVPPVGFPGLAWTGRTANASDWGVGATAGAIWQPTPWTSIGLGYRSPVELNPSGVCSGFGLTNIEAGLVGGNPLGCIGGTSIHSSITLPETVTLSARQQLNDRLALLGTFEWTHWGRVRATFAYNDAGVAVDSVPVSFDDGWFFSLGGEYKYGPALTLRAGLSYEKSPVTDANRTQFLPDADRLTPSIGASYKWSERVTIDLAYSHLFFNSGSLREVATLPAPIGPITFLDAVANTDVDFVSLGVKYRWSASAPLESYK